MAQEEAIKLFENSKVRIVWDDEKEKYFFSIIDVIQILTDTDRPRKYWNDLKIRLTKEGSELSAKIGQLKLQISSISIKCQTFLQISATITGLAGRNQR